MEYAASLFLRVGQKYCRARKPYLDTCEKHTKQLPFAEARWSNAVFCYVAFISGVESDESDKLYSLPEQTPDSLPSCKKL